MLCYGQSLKSCNEISAIYSLIINTSPGGRINGSRQLGNI